MSLFLKMRNDRKKGLNWVVKFGQIGFHCDFFCLFARFLNARVFQLSTNDGKKWLVLLSISFFLLKTNPNLDSKLSLALCIENGRTTKKIIFKILNLGISSTSSSFPPISRRQTAKVKLIRWHKKTQKLLCEIEKKQHCGGKFGKGCCSKPQKKMIE